jgi:Tfp pilus assembly protein PilV
MVEFLVAAVILGVGLLGMASLLTAGITQSTKGRARISAAYIADQILEQAQMEGQHYFLAKSSSLTPVLTAVFTASPGTALDLATYGQYNVDGVQVRTAAGANVANLATLVPDPSKRNPVFTASWSRRGYAGTAPVSTCQAQEFVVNVNWVEGGLNRNLSISRSIRY